MQHQDLQQLPLSQRILSLADAIRSCRAQKAAIEKEEAEYTALLKQAEQELKVHPPGSEDTAPSGLLADSPTEQPKPAPMSQAPNAAAQAAQKATATAAPKKAAK
jgi:hypothetical protein